MLAIVRRLVIHSIWFHQYSLIQHKGQLYILHIQLQYLWRANFEMNFSALFWCPVFFALSDFNKKYPQQSKFPTALVLSKRDITLQVIEVINLEMQVRVLRGRRPKLFWDLSQERILFLDLQLIKLKNQQILWENHQRYKHSQFFYFSQLLQFRVFLTDPFFPI